MPTSRRRWRSSKPTDRWRGRRGSPCSRRCCLPKGCSRRRRTPRRAPARRWRWGRSAAPRLAGCWRRRRRTRRPWCGTPGAAPCGSAVRVGEGVDRKQLQQFVSLLLSYGAKEATPNKVHELGQKLADSGVTHIGVEAPLETDEDGEDSERQKEAAKRTYARSVAVTKEVINSIRMGRTANVKKVKRAVQGIVDQVLNNEGSLVRLTTLRDYDEYTFTHSVNVCIFSVALGRKLGLSKLQLYDLGMAALFHDVGKSRVPLEVLNKEGGLSEEEWRIMQAHPWLGVLTLFGLRGYGEIPYRGMVVAYEHHMKNDLTGYPKSVRDRTLS